MSNTLMPVNDPTSASLRAGIILPVEISWVVDQFWTVLSIFFDVKFVMVVSIVEIERRLDVVSEVQFFSALSSYF
jgi:hypothetical protein